MLYRPLDAAINEIRVLTIQPSEHHEAPLLCGLQTRALADGPPFESLSYAWGKEAALVPLSVATHKLLITKNLDSALRAVRRPGQVIELWADAICINQQDVRERNQQVQLMRKIYTSATQVNVYLGHGFPGDSDAFAILAGLAKGTLLRTIVASDSVPKAAQRVEQLKRIFDSPWWTRLWVIQEVSLADEAILYCGANSISFRTILEAFENLWNEYISTGQQLRHLCGAKAIESLIRQLESTVRRLHVIQSFLYLPTSTGKRRFRDSTTALPYLLHTCSWSDVTDPRDKIYGALGLLPSATLAPDYSLSVEQVFAKAAFEIMNRMENLALLTQKRFTNFDDRLPSWVPDWTRPSVLTAPFLVFRDFYRAGGKTSQDLHFLDDNSLQLNAIVTDEIVQIGEVYDHQNSTKSADLPAILKPTLMDWKRLFSSLPANNKIDGNAEPLPKHQLQPSAIVFPNTLAEDQDNSLRGAVLPPQSARAPLYTDSDYFQAMLKKWGGMTALASSAKAMTANSCPANMPTPLNTVAGATCSPKRAVPLDGAHMPQKGFRAPLYEDGDYMPQKGFRAPLYEDGDHSTLKPRKAARLIPSGRAADTMHNNFPVQSQTAPLYGDADYRKPVSRATPVSRADSLPNANKTYKRYDSSSHTYVQSATETIGRGTWYPGSQAELLSWFAKHGYSWQWQAAVRSLGLDGAEFLQEAKVDLPSLFRRILLNVHGQHTPGSMREPQSIYVDQHPDCQKLKNHLSEDFYLLYEIRKHARLSFDTSALSKAAGKIQHAATQMRDAFWRTLCTDVVDCQVFQKHRRCSPPDEARVQEWLEWLEGKSGPKGGIPQLHWHLNTVLQKKRMIRTSEGRMGMASEDVKPGDKICVFGGEAYPYVLRPVDSNDKMGTYRLVCPVYLHGLMDGEALDLYPTQMQTLQLV